MLRRRALIAGAAAALAAAAAALRPGAVSVSSTADASAPPSFDDLLSVAAPGDVLFKSSAGGFWGNMASAFSAGDDRFGHVGIVARTGTGALTVIHAGGDPVSREGRVRADPIVLFLSGVEAAALYRPDAEQAVLTSMLAYAEAAADRAAPFDRQFSLTSEDRLYCTELVWRALGAAGAGDAVPQKSVRAGRVYISLADLQASPALRLVALSPAAPPPAGPGGERNIGRAGGAAP